MKKLTSIFAFIMPVLSFGGPGVTVEVDVLINAPGSPLYPTTDPVMADQDNDRHDSDCAGGQRESCEGQRE